MGDEGMHRRADDLLDAALDLPAAERRTFLDRECGGDARLRALVERLLTDSEETLGGTLATGGGLAGLPDATEAAPPDLAGTTLGRYRLVREIGRGGMGVVYEGRDETLDRTVAVKVLPASSIDERAHERFLREARAAAALNHPGIVALHDAGEGDGRRFLVMEYVDGASLSEHPPATLDDALAIAARICDALEHAHARGIVHRDLKPGNVLVSLTGDPPIVKLTDLGIAIARGTERVTRAGAILGTPTYMAPEQALGREVDGRADLYALGVMLYQWVVGRPPFEGDDALAIVSQHIHAPVAPPRAFRPDLPAGLEVAILRLLAKAPDARYASAAEARAALADAAAAPASREEPAVGTLDGLTRGRMVGRREELQRLQRLWKAALGGACHLALVSGEPGVGKTRLARELIASARIDGAAVLSGGCYENEATTPYLPFVEAFRRVVHDRDDRDLAAALGDSAAELARLAPEIESRLGPFPERPPLAPQEQRLRLFDAFARFLARVAAPSGLLVFLDDLQWADHGSLAVLHYLLRQLSGERVLVLATYRDVELDRTHPLSKALVDWNRERLTIRVRLERLDRESTARMVGILLGQDDLTGELVDALHRETEGNPFFVEEIVKALIADGGLVREPSGWSRRPAGEVILPQSVKAAIGSRLSRIGAACSDVLRAAAVLGTRFDFAELAAVTDGSEDAVLDALDEAVRAQLVAAGRGDAFAFTHDKIREVLYEELNPIRRRRVHGRIAKAMEARHAAGDDGVAVEDLAFHFVESGNCECGLVWAERAADAARRVFAWDEATAMLTRARECAVGLARSGDVVRLDAALGDVAYAHGEIRDAAEHYERALAAAGADLRNNLRCKAGEVYVTTGDPRGLDLVHAALAELDPERDPQLSAVAIMVEGRYRHLAGALREAVERYRRAIALAEPTARVEFLVRLHAHLAGSHQHLAEYDESDVAAERCIELGERHGVPEGVMLGCEFRCENDTMRGRWRDAIERGEREERLARETHAGERLAWSQLRALAYHGIGRLDRADELFTRGIEMGERLGERRLALLLRMFRAACLIDLGRPDDALESVAPAVREADDSGLLGHRVIGRGCLVDVLVRTGRIEEAVREARTAVELWTASESYGAALWWGAWVAEALARGGHLDEARAVLDAHARLAERTSSPFRLAQNRATRALLSALAGRPEEACERLRQAIADLEAADGVTEAARARTLL